MRIKHDSSHKHIPRQQSVLSVSKTQEHIPYKKPTLAMHIMYIMHIIMAIQ